MSMHNYVFIGPYAVTNLSDTPNVGDTQEAISEALSPKQFRDPDYEGMVFWLPNWGDDDMRDFTYGPNEECGAAHSTDMQYEIEWFQEKFEEPLQILGKYKIAWGIITYCD
jgi:hypothetical protein